MATARTRAGDLTGRTKERLQKENQEELKKRAEEISLMAEVEAEQNETPVDYTEGPNPKVEEDLEVAPLVELQEPTRTIILNTSLESMTFGAGKHYTFDEGRKYTVPADLAEHLREKGLLWEGSYR